MILDILYELNMHIIVPIDDTFPIVHIRDVVLDDLEEKLQDYLSFSRFE